MHSYALRWGICLIVIMSLCTPCQGALLPQDTGTLSPKTLFEKNQPFVITREEAQLHRELDSLLSSSPRDVRVDQLSPRVFYAFRHAQHALREARQGLESVVGERVIPFRWVEMFLYAVTLGYFARDEKVPRVGGPPVLKNDLIAAYLGHLAWFVKAQANLWWQSKRHEIMQSLLRNPHIPKFLIAMPFALIGSYARSFFPESPTHATQLSSSWSAVPILVLGIAELLDKYIPLDPEILQEEKVALLQSAKPLREKLAPIQARLARLQLGLSLKAKGIKDRDDLNARRRHLESLRTDMTRRGVPENSPAWQQFDAVYGKYTVLIRAWEIIDQLKKQEAEVLGQLEALKKERYILEARLEIGRLEARMLGLDERYKQLNDLQTKARKHVSAQRDPQTRETPVRAMPGLIERMEREKADTKSEIDALTNAILANIYYVTKDNAYPPSINHKALAQFYEKRESLRGFAEELQTEINIRKEVSSHFGAAQRFPFTRQPRQQRNVFMMMARLLRTEGIHVEQKDENQFLITHEKGLFEPVNMQVAPKHTLASLARVNIQTRTIRLNQAALVSPLLVVEVLHQELDKFSIDEEKLDIVELISMLRSFRRIAEWPEPQQQGFFNLLESKEFEFHDEHAEGGDKTVQAIDTHGYRNLVRSYVEKGLTIELIKDMAIYIRKATIIYAPAISGQLQHKSDRKVFLLLADYFEKKEQNDGLALQLYLLAKAAYPRDPETRTAYTQTRDRFVQDRDLPTLVEVLEPTLMAGDLITRILEDDRLDETDLALLRQLRLSGTLQLAQKGMIRQFLVGRGELPALRRVLKSPEEDLADQLLAALESAEVNL